MVETIGIRCPLRSRPNLCFGLPETDLGNVQRRDSRHGQHPYGKAGRRVSAYREHVERLCADNGIALEFAGRSGRAWRKTRRIRTPEIRSAVTYAIALHEIGHILGDGQNGRRLDKEVGAWLWAKANAIEWRKPMKRTLKTRLASYLRWCQRRRGAWIPPVNHPAWKLAA